MSKHFLIITPYTNTYFERLNLSTFDFCRNNEELQEIDTEEYEYVVDLRGPKDNIIYGFYEQKGMEGYKIKGETVLMFYKSDSTNYINLDYKKYFIVGEKLEEVQKHSNSKIVAQKSGIENFFQMLINKIRLSNTNDKKSVIMSTGVEVNDFAKIKSKTRYKLVDDISNIVDEKGVEAVALDELTFINTVHEKLLRCIEAS